MQGQCGQTGFDLNMLAGSGLRTRPSRVGSCVNKPLRNAAPIVPSRLFVSPACIRLPVMGLTGLRLQESEKLLSHKLTVARIIRMRGLNALTTFANKVCDASCYGVSRYRYTISHHSMSRQREGRQLS